MRKGNAWVPYRVFLGYEKGTDGKMIVNKNQATIVKRIYGMFQQGFSTHHIGKVFENEGIEFSEGNKKWYGSTIFSMD